MGEAFKVIIAGSRDFSNYTLLKRMCVSILCEKRKSTEIEIVSGKCRGADALGERFAEDQGYPVKPFPYLKQYGKAGGPIRNAQMADYADALILFWNGKSKGSRNMKQEAEKRGLLIREVMI